MKLARLLLPAAAIALAACNDTSLQDKPEAPIAVIDGIDTYAPLDVALFDGSASYSEQSVVVGWEWALVSRPAGSNFALEPDASDPRIVRFHIDLAGDYAIELTVTDERGMKGSSVFEFSAVPWQKVHVELTWDLPETDVDLHFVSENEGGMFYGEPFDCFYRNTNPDWGATGESGDDPSIDIDDVDGLGPENVSLNQPGEGYRYRVFVHYYDARGNGATNATVRIYLSGKLRFEGIQPLDGTGAGWEVATIDWPSGEVVASGDTFVHDP